MNTTIHFRDNDLIPIWDKVQNGTRLTLQDGLTMFASQDIISIGKMAHAVQQMKSGPLVGNEPIDAGAEVFAARLPAMASAAMMTRKRPINIAAPGAEG